MIERLSGDLETQTGEPHANPISGDLIGSANTRRIRVLSYWILEQSIDHLLAFFNS